MHHSKRRIAEDKTRPRSRTYHTLNAFEVDPTLLNKKHYTRIEETGSVEFKLPDGIQNSEEKKTSQTPTEPRTPLSPISVEEEGYLKEGELYTDSSEDPNNKKEHTVKKDTATAIIPGHLVFVMFI